jgi:hypothetical protein
MPVALFPPVTHGGADPRHYADAVPLTEALRWMRGPGNARWHRVRWGVRHGDHVSWSYWCNPASSFKLGGPYQLDELADGEPTCARCVELAERHDQDGIPLDVDRYRQWADLARRPAVCPGSRRAELCRPFDETLRVGVCLACGVTEQVRPYSGYTRSSYGLARHAPNLELLDPCPWHEWRDVVAVGEAAGCRCGWHQREALE